MLDIARRYHPACSNDPRILACAQPCPKSPTAVQRALSRQEHNAAADRGSRLKSTLGSCSPTPPVATTARRAGLARALHFGASSAHGRHHPPAPARRRLVASRQPWALSVLPIRNGSSRTGRGPEQAPIRTSSTRLAGEPAHRSATRPGATAHRRTPEPLRRARHSARTARPEASAHDRTG